MPIQVPARGLVFAAGAAVASFALSCLVAHPAMAQSDVVRIGIVSPNTGAAARYGAFAWRGAQLARDQINAAGGINGKKIELFQGDSQCIPTEGVSSVQRMIAQEPDLVGAGTAYWMGVAVDAAALAQLMEDAHPDDRPRVHPLDLPVQQILLLLQLPDRLAQRRHRQLGAAPGIRHG